MSIDAPLSPVPLYQGIRIESAELRIVSLPLLTPFVISSGTMTAKTFPLLVLKGEGIEGVAEAVMDPAPDYLEETIPGAMAFLREVLLPQIVGKRFASPYDLQPVLSPWRGNRMAKAVVEMAFWDLWAKSLGLPLKAGFGRHRRSCRRGRKPGHRAGGDHAGTGRRGG